MLTGIEVLCHSSIRIDKNLKLYIDPYKIKEEYKDADVIFITHTHYDHFSEEDIEKVRKEDTILVGPEDCLIKALTIGFSEDKIFRVDPGQKYEVLGMNFETVPAYNLEKQYHSKESGWLRIYFRNK